MNPAIGPFRVIQEYKKVASTQEVVDIYTHISEALNVDRTYVKEILTCYLYSMGMSKDLNNRVFLELMKKNFNPQS